MRQRMRREGERENREKKRVRKTGPTIFQDADLNNFKKILGIGINFKEIFRAF